MYSVLSFSHKKLEISIRERIAFPQSELDTFYAELFAKFPQIKECVLLSTCNRFELILFAQMQDLSPLLEFIASYRQIDLKLLQEGAQIFYAHKAVEHIFRVASSLDSLVVGETQITGQLRDAYKLSYELGFCQRELTRVIHFAFKTAAMIRSETQISKNPTSVASVAISHFLSLVKKKEKVVVVGSGEIGSLCIKYLLNQDFEVVLLSRTLENAQALKDEINDERIEVLPFAELSRVLNTYPYLFSATGADHMIITQEMIKPCDFHRIWFDLALPRDIEHCQREDITLFEIDDLQGMVANNKDKREEEAKKAQEIIAEQIYVFFQWLDGLEVEPIIKALREKAKQCCFDEVSRAVKKGFLDSQNEEEVLRILHNTFNKFLHHPTLYIKKIKEKPESDFVLENIKQLFDLEEEKSLSNPYKCEIKE